MDTLTSWPDALAMSRRETNQALGVAFGSVVKSIREDAGYSQEGFAHEAGIDRSFWGAIERGRYNPSLGTIWRVAEALGKRPRDVMAAVEKAMAASTTGKESSSSTGSRTKTSTHLDKDGRHLRKVTEPTRRGRKS